jgi:hypothetical protein
MNPRQLAFFRQAQSDWTVFRHFHPSDWRWWNAVLSTWCGLVGVRPFSFPRCHALHYLQMCTEKLAKAYYTATPARTGHNAFRRFMTDLPSNPTAIAPLRFVDVAALTMWQGSAYALVGAIEDLAPAIADRLHQPNPEYPWPKGAEAHAPVDHSFHAEIYARLEAQAASGQPSFLDVLGRMMATMQSGGWHL